MPAPPLLHLGSSWVSKSSYFILEVQIAGRSEEKAQYLCLDPSFQGDKESRGRSVEGQVMNLFLRHRSVHTVAGGSHTRGRPVGHGCHHVTDVRRAQRLTHNAYANIVCVCSSSEQSGAFYSLRCTLLQGVAFRPNTTLKPPSRRRGM